MEAGRTPVLTNKYMYAKAALEAKAARSKG
jgi:hypothetical protein